MIRAFALAVALALPSFGLAQEARKADAYLTTEETLDLFVKMREDPSGYVGKEFNVSAWLIRVDPEVLQKGVKAHRPTLYAGRAILPELIQIDRLGDSPQDAKFAILFKTKELGREAEKLDARTPLLIKVAVESVVRRLADDSEDTTAIAYITEFRDASQPPAK